MIEESQVDYFEPNKGDLLLEGQDGRISPEVRAIIAEAQSALPNLHVATIELAQKVGECEGVDINVVRIKDYPRDISGSIRRTGEAGYKIAVNVHHHFFRRRFTIAHELAHFILHREQIGDGITEDLMLRSEQMSIEAEWEANSLAAAILMPRKLMKAVALRMDLDSRFIVEAVSDFCKVSIPAAHIRLGSSYLLRDNDDVDA